MGERGETELLYQTDSYLRECIARVVSADPATRTVTLDRTIFYPAGGGQPHDLGTLTADGWQGQVVEVRKAGPDVHHILADTVGLPEPGSSVTCRIDWDRRYALMRMHTALHVLCGTVFRDYGALVTGGNMTPDHSRMDFEMDSSDFTPERVAEIEQHANEEIAQERDVRVRILPREEAFAIPDLIRTKINLLPPGISRIRTVEVVGLDLQADGGTHVANTREVGGLNVIGTRSKGKSNKRLEIALASPSAPPTGA
ncbi:MAG TPA: alanyl-tRNA editing protein [Thermomicrobiales bacterium]|nr:alanyl-tRNA editing protein [Thermomicrobiales bacterium]